MCAYDSTILDTLAEQAGARRPVPRRLLTALGLLITTAAWWWLSFWLTPPADGRLRIWLAGCLALAALGITCGLLRRDVGLGAAVGGGWLGLALLLLGAEPGAATAWGLRPVATAWLLATYYSLPRGSRLAAQTARGRRRGSWSEWGQSGWGRLRGGWLAGGGLGLGGAVWSSLDRADPLGPWLGPAWLTILLGCWCWSLRCDGLEWHQVVTDWVSTRLLAAVGLAVLLPPLLAGDWSPLRSEGTSERLTAEPAVALLAGQETRPVAGNSVGGEQVAEGAFQLRSHRGLAFTGLVVIAFAAFRWSPRRIEVSEAVPLLLAGLATLAATDWFWLWGTVWPACLAPHGLAVWYRWQRLG